MAMEFVRDLVFIAALAAVFVGVWWIYPPAALITVGGLVVLAFMFGKIGNREKATGEDNDDSG